MLVLESKRSETHLTEEPTSAGTYELKSMTHEETIKYIRNILGFGSFNHRLPIKSWVGKQPQWRMRFANHDTWLLAKWLHPHAITKKLEWEKVLKHYDYAA